MKRFLSVLLAVAALVGAAATCEYHPGFVQAKLSNCSGDPAYKTITNLILRTSQDRVDYTLTTLMSDQFCSSSSSYVKNPVTGRRWNWDNSNGAFVYEGEMYLVGGLTYGFWAECDDSAVVYVEGTSIVRGTTSSGRTGTYTPAQSGWYKVAFSSLDYSGGKGSSGYGFAWNTNGLTKTGGTLSKSTANWHAMTDPGDMSLFRYKVDFDHLKTASNLAQYDFGDPQFGYVAVTPGVENVLPAPTAAYTNVTLHTYCSCCGWRFTTKGGVVTSGDDLTFRLTPDETTLGGTLTWRFAEHPIDHVDHYLVPPGTAGVTPTAPYSTWETAATNMADVLKSVGTWSCVNVAPGVYSVTDASGITLSQSCLLVRSRTRDGKSARDTTIFDGGYPARSNRLFNVTASSVSLQGLTFRNAAMNADGGAIRASASNFRLADSVVSNCWAVAPTTTSRSGGGLSLAYVRAQLVTNTLFFGCRAGNGGAIVCGGTGSQGGILPRIEMPVVSDCSFVSNVAIKVGSSHPQGAGIFGTIWVEHSRFFDNQDPSKDSWAATAVAFGNYAIATNCVFEHHVNCASLAGRADPSGATAYLCGCTFKDNAVTYLFRENTQADGCLFISNKLAWSSYSHNGKITVRNSLFFGNDGPVYPGSDPLENCTIVSNSYGLYLNYGNVPTIRNCVSWGNLKKPSGNNMGTPDFCYERGWSQAGAKSGTFYNNVILGCEKLPTWYDSGKTFSFASLDKTGASSNVIAKATEKGIRFRDEANGDWRLKRNSPLRDAGQWQSWMTGASDPDGRPRCLNLRGKATADALPDIGCYECEISKPGAVLLVR